MAEGSSSTTTKKWACKYCTYLNWEASSKCVLCYQPRDLPMIIEELCPPSAAIVSQRDVNHSRAFNDELEMVKAEEVRWPCPSCTYQNCRRTKRCIQCQRERPVAYVTPPTSPKNSGDESNLPQQQNVQNIQESQQLISRVLKKWSCQACTFDNWPTALKCTICDQLRSVTATMEKSRSSPPQHQQTQRKRSETSQQRQEGNTIEQTDLERLDQLIISGAAAVTGRPDYASALDIYIRRFCANDSVEKLFFKAANAIGNRDLQMMNRVVDYLINEGNLQRGITAIEARIMNQQVARGGNYRVIEFERADTLFYLANKSDCKDLVKLIRRVRPEEDRLPCALNCAIRNRLYAKITTQCMAVRDGMGPFKCQFITEPHNFCLLNMPMSGSDLSLSVQNALFRPSPSIPPQLCYIDCFDAMASQSGRIVGKPPNFLLRNRGGSRSLYDAVFQCMFGVCDRFNILRAAAKYTLHRSTNLFKLRWLEQQLRMIKDCGLSVNSNELDGDWDELINSVGEDVECTEPIHIWTLAHVCCRPIIVCSLDDPVDVDELVLPLVGGGGNSPSPPGNDGHSPSPRRAGQQEEDGDGNGMPASAHAHAQQQTANQRNDQKQPPRQANHHSYEGIYLPIFWAPSAPISRSPLILTYRNGQFNAVLVSDGFYQRDTEVQRYVRIRRNLRRPGTAGDSLFRFLSRAELDNSALLAQFILLGQCNAQQLCIRREPHTYLLESLYLYKNWMQAMLQLSVEQNTACGTSTTGQLENRMDAILAAMAAGNKKRKGGGGGSPPLLQQHQQTLMAQLFSPTVNQQLLPMHVGSGGRQSQFMAPPHSGGRSSSPEEESGGGDHGGVGGGGGVDGPNDENNAASRQKGNRKEEQ